MPIKPGDASQLANALVVVIGPAEGHPRWPGICGGARRYLTAVPSLRAVVAAPSDATSDSLMATLRPLLDLRPNAVCLFIADPNAAHAAAELILSRQVLLVTMGRRLEDLRVSEHISVDWLGAAELLGESLSSIAGGRRSYLLVHENGRGTEATNCYLRFRSGVAQEYDMVLLQESVAPADGSPPERVVEELLGRFSHAGLLVTLNPDVWLSAGTAWKRELRQRNGTFRFATLGAPPKLWRQLGTPAAPGDAAALVGPLDGEIGFAALEVVVHLIVNPNGRSPGHTIPCELVTAATLPDFARRYSVAANGLDVSFALPTATTSAKSDQD